MPGDRDNKLPAMKQGPALNQDRPAVTSTEKAFNDEPQVLNQTRAVVGLPRMMMAACIVLLTINSDLYEGCYYYYYYKYYNYYLVGATVSDFGLLWDLLAEIDFLVNSYSLSHS